MENKASGSAFFMGMCIIRVGEVYDRDMAIIRSNAVCRYSIYSAALGLGKMRKDGVWYTALFRCS